MSVSVVCGMQWGDEGKGKIIDFLSADADYVVRYQGGSNAGHTVVVGSEKFILRQLPSGAMSPTAKCLLAAGVVIDPQVLLDEIESLAKRGVRTNHIFISERAHLIMPYHIALDKLKETSLGDKKLGTTGRGIGPCYMDKYERTGLRAVDLLDRETLREKILERVATKNELITKIYQSEPLDGDAIVASYLKFADSLAHRIIDTTTELHMALSSGKKVLFEGAQATMLDIDHGDYPYVTSSSPTVGSACVGAGVAPNMLEHRIGIFKGYSTRVGEGPFPTELHDETGEKIRTVGHEFGSVTSRPRRTGWLDLPILKYACGINGFNELALMKIDVLTGFKELPVCMSYEVDGKKLSAPGANLAEMQKAKPIYKIMSGWSEDLSAFKHYADLPKSVKEYVELIEKECGVPIATISVGPERAQTIKR